MDGWVDGWTDGLDWIGLDWIGSMDGWMVHPSIHLSSVGWTDGWVDGWMDGYMDGWMDGWTRSNPMSCPIDTFDVRLDLNSVDFWRFTGGSQT